jgi:hypothetical protein
VTIFIWQHVVRIMEYIVRKEFVSKLRAAALNHIMQKVFMGAIKQTSRLSAMLLQCTAQCDTLENVQCCTGNENYLKKFVM